MGLFSRFKKTEFKQPRTPFVLNYGQLTPPDRNLQGFLNAYGEIGWLYAVVSRIAEGVSEAKWRLYSVDQKGERTLIYNNPIISLLDFVNPFQTCQEFIELHQIYMGLCGECFWVINKNKLGEPQELWIAPPEKMSVIPSKTEFVSGYVYRIGNEKIPFNKDEVIHHKLPNPLNPYRGLGAVQALAIDLDSELYAGRWNRNFFYNSARPDGIIAFEGTLSEEQFDRLKKQWGERHEGVNKAHKVGLLEGGGKYQQIQFNAKDMDFKSLRLLNRDNILGVYGMPLSVMGITENVNKANAEAGDYTFARWLVKPRLNRIKNKLNEQLLPMFKGSKNLELDFDEVVPQTLEQKQLLAESGIRAGYMTINEARQLQGLDPLPNDVGKVLLVPLNLIPMPIDAPLEPPPVPTEEPDMEFEENEELPKSKTFSSEWKETFWRGYVTRAEAYEKKMIIGLKGMFNKQESEAVRKLESGSKDLIDLPEAKIQYTKVAEPILTDLLKQSFYNGTELINPKPHKADEPISEAALRWLKTRIGWAATQIGEETALLLSKMLAEGYELGEDIPTIAKRIREVFADCDKRRSVLIARTETISASAHGAIEGYKEAGLEKAEFMASLDDRTCDDCDSMDGEEFLLEDCVGIIPVHPDCRCTFLPVI